MINDEHREQLFSIYPVLDEVEPQLLEKALANARLVGLKSGAQVFD